MNAQSVQQLIEAGLPGARVQVESDDDTHFAAIGRLDILMVPIDGTFTMSLDGVSEITKRLRSAVVLPMHRFATPLDEFMRLIGQQFVIDHRSERTLMISRETLPGTPTVIILDGV